MDPAEAAQLFARAVASKANTKVTKVDLELSDFRRIFSLRRLHYEKGKPEHGRWSYTADDMDRHRWLKLLLATCVRDPYEPQYEYHGFSPHHTTARQTGHYQRAREKQSRLRRSARQKRNKARAQLTPRIVRDKPASRLAGPAPPVEALAEEDEVYVFPETLEHAMMKMILLMLC